MIITYHGLGMAKLQVGDTVVAANPIKETKGVKAPRFGADLVLVSLADPGWNGAENMAYGERVPFLVAGPGEYEVSDIFIRGIESRGPAGKVNTIYTLNLDNLNVCHLGALADEELSNEALEAIGVVDILFLPAGDYGTLPAKAAAKVAAAIAPKLIVPVAYESEATLKGFLKELGESDPEKTDKLTIKRRDLEGKEGEVVIVNAS
ncbi:MAG: hypothetical protein A2114_00415 [Candidatus Vogelbacteria bacterium GWA1_51_14]|uniref:Zn-dependent hydrolase n=1 Tax=Candidatus Vogelbacteria bacterium GWA1_51_14 TaxID=1802435 RepID=A0A1G2QBH1_9BACT|nr:MAG: hypothetical protein A2114_00415 [Candidatus Vogelbacteria bacterium GWA1_51_14]